MKCARAVHVRPRARKRRQLGALGRLLVALLWLTWAPVVQAEEPADYQRTIDAALEEYREAHYEEARGLFQHAHALSPSARTLRGLGMVEFELRHYVASAALLEQALASSQKPLTAEQRVAALELLARTQRFVARYRLQVVPSGLAFQVEVDGVVTALEPEQRLTLSAGEHRVTLSAPGYQTSERVLDARGGEEQPLSMALKPAPKQAAVAVVQRDAAVPESELGAFGAGASSGSSASRPTRPHRRLGITLTAVGSAALASGLTVGALALRRARNSEDGVGADADGATHMALGADLSIGLGAAMLVSGVVLWLWRRDERPTASRAGLHVEHVLPNLRVSF
jgi:hypothetical protein